MGGDGTAQRPAEEDDPVRCHLSHLGQILPGGLGIAVGSRLGDLPLASPVPAVIDDQDRQAQVMKDPERIKAVGNIAGIAVEKEEHIPFLPGWYIPAVQPDPVAGGDVDILVSKPDVSRGPAQFPACQVGEVQELGLHEKKKDAKKEIHPPGQQQQRDNEIYGRGLHQLANTPPSRYKLSAIQGSWGGAGLAITQISINQKANVELQDLVPSQ